MLMIRFQRIGRKNDPAFRIAVLEKTSGPKAGKYVDLVGSYNPKTKATTVLADKVKDWAAKGAQISPSVMNLLIKEGVYEGKKIPAVSKKNLEKNVAANAEKARKEAEAAAAAAEAAALAAAPKVEEVAEVAPVEEVVEAAPIEEVPAEPVAETEMPTQEEVTETPAVEEAAVVAE